MIKLNTQSHKQTRLNADGSLDLTVNRCTYVVKSKSSIKSTVLKLGSPISSISMDPVFVHWEKINVTLKYVSGGQRDRLCCIRIIHAVGPVRSVAF